MKPQPTTVVKVNWAISENPPEGAVYIGRANSRYKFTRVRSAWHNPFQHGMLGSKHVTRADAINKYIDFIRANPAIIARAEAELRGKILVCWCRPLECHGDALAAAADGRLNEWLESRARRSETLYR